MIRGILSVFVIGFGVGCSEQKLQGDEDAPSHASDEGAGATGDDGTGDVGVDTSEDPTDTASEGTGGDGTGDDSASEAGDGTDTGDGVGDCDPTVADCDTECVCSAHHSPFEDDCMPDECVDTCTSGGGFWANHPEDWPTDVAAVWLGDVCLGQEEVVELLGLSNAGGDTSISLATALVSARLNLAAGIASTSELDAALTAADQWIIAHAGEDGSPDAAGLYGTLPYAIHSSTEAGTAAKSIQDVLSSYLGGGMPEVCDGTATGWSDSRTAPSCPAPEETTDASDGAGDTGTVPL